MMINEQELHSLVQALHTELRFPQEPSVSIKTRLVNTLYDKPPPRHQLTFQTHSHTESALKATAKSRLASSSELSSEYCPGHKEFTHLMNTDIDHIFPQSAIRARQSAFLDLLNGDRGFADALLEVTGMSDYFRRDLTGHQLLDVLLSGATSKATLTTTFSLDTAAALLRHLPTQNQLHKREQAVQLITEFVQSAPFQSFLQQADQSPSARRILLNNPIIDDTLRNTVKGTGYFYKICYNNFDNLWLLCRGCNIQKSHQSPLHWFTEQYGEPFVKDLKTAGILRTGLIMERIYEPDCSAIGLSHTFEFHYGKSIGLGEFINQWCEKTQGQAITLQRKFFCENYQDFKEQIWQLQTLREKSALTENESEKKTLLEFINKRFKSLERLAKLANDYVQAKLRAHHDESISSATDSDTSADEVKAANEKADIDAKQNCLVSIKKIIKTLYLEPSMRYHYPREEVKQIYRLALTTPKRYNNLSLDEFRQILAQVKEHAQEINAGTRTQPDLLAYTYFLNNICKTEQEKNEAIIARQDKEIAQLKAQNAEHAQQSEGLARILASFKTTQTALRLTDDDELSDEQEEASLLTRKRPKPAEQLSSAPTKKQRSDSRTPEHTPPSWDAPFFSDNSSNDELHKSLTQSNSQLIDDDEEEDGTAHSSHRTP
jgi:hypothetical protein